MVCTLSTFNLRSLISRGPKIITQIVLLVIFLIFFGMPAIERFLKKEVLIVETLKHTDGVPSPAITFSVPGQVTSHSCFDKNLSAEDCLEKTFLKQPDIIKSVIVGVTLQREANLTGGNIREDFSFSRDGIYCVTQLKLDTVEKLSSSIFCCLCVCEASVTPDQISTFSKVSSAG